jgi:hypothetical protein
MQVIPNYLDGDATNKYVEELEKPETIVPRGSVHHAVRTILMSVYFRWTGEFTAAPEKLVSWAGLCPSIHQSVNSLYMGSMKNGNKKVRWIVIQAANTAARKDDRLRKFYL